jgi:hypothetical protein
MRNHITTTHCALSTASVEAHRVTSVATSNQRLELVHDERSREAEASQSSSPCKSAPASSDFEGFGSFS